MHHGNGTQWAFYDDPSVLFISSHQYPYYPGTGAATETGTGKGAGFTINLPLEAGATDADYDLVYTSIALPALRHFRPDLILVSAGFDAFADDPLGGMRVTAAQFARLTALLVDVADECCSGRIAAVTEGGYDLAGFAACLRAVTPVLAGDVGLKECEAPGGAVNPGARRGRATIDAVLPHLRQAWKL